MLRCPAMKNTRTNWKLVEFNGLAHTTSSGDLYALPVSVGPEWLIKVPCLMGVYALRHATHQPLSTENLTTSEAIATLRTERFYPRIGKWKYDDFPQIALRDGRCFQCGPIKEVDCGHHRRERAPFVSEALPYPGPST